MLEFLAWHYWSLCVAAPYSLLSGRAAPLALRVWGGPAFALASYMSDFLAYHY
jgi:hypothetical protein